MEIILPDQLTLRPGTAGILFQISNPQGQPLLRAAGPSFEVDGQTVAGFTWNGQADCLLLDHGGVAFTLGYLTPADPRLELSVSLRTFPGSPFLRWRYTLRANAPAALTKTSGTDQLCYVDLGIVGQAGLLSEVQLSQFEPVLHSYLPGLETRPLASLAEGEALPGPILALPTAGRCLFAAYEHGADHPDSFLAFTLQPGPDETRIQLRARRGNYYAGQPLDRGQGWVSPWLQLGLQAGGLDALFARYRRFMLEEINPWRASRRSLVCYNTWNYQERNHLYNGRPYLETLNLERMLAEVDIAHELGVDIFVIDTGWYEKTGDWQVSQARFPDGLRQVKARLEGYGMQLGLWFNPLAAALSSQIYREHPEYEMSWNGQLSAHNPIWETEESASLCLASAVLIMAKQTKPVGEKLGCNPC